MHSWRTSRTGLTLIEVIAGLALLGTLLVSTMLAYGRHVRQLKRAREQTLLLKKLDTLVTSWFLQEEALWIPAEGRLPDTPDYRWKRTLTRQSPRNQEGLLISRVEAWKATTSSDDQPLCAIELATPSPASTGGGSP